MKRPPARIPQALLMIVRQGRTISAARNFGARMNSTGSIAMVRRASISSATTMLPISAENADPERPLTAIAVSNGPNSRVKPMVTRSTTNCIAPKRRSSEAPCIARMKPAQMAMIATMGTAATPTANIWPIADLHRLRFPSTGNVRPKARIDP